MNLTKIAINTLLLCVFPIRLLIVWMPILGYPHVATFFAMIEYLCILYLILQSFSFHNKANKAFSWYYLLYWIYSLFLIYYIIIHPLIPRDSMLSIPLKDSRVIQDIITIGLICPLIAKFHVCVDYIRFSKISAILLYGILIIYALTQNIAVYTFIRSLDNDMLGDYGLVSALVLGQYISMAFFFSLWVKDYWTSNKTINSIIFVITLLFTLFFLLILTQRGPMLFFLLTLLYYIYSRYSINFKTIFTILVFIALFIIFFNDIVLVVRSISPDIVDRFLSIQEDGGSGRFGDDNSVYYLAIRQIRESPFVGSYFRLVSGSIGHYGSYPHNFILELLMTFGLVFTLPFIWLVLIAVRNSYKEIHIMSPVGVFGLVYIYIYLSLLTSHSIALDVQAWSSLALILSIKKNKETQIIYNGKKI